MQENLPHILLDFLVDSGVSESVAKQINLWLLLLVILLVAWLLDLVIWKVLRLVTVRLSRRTRTRFDDFLVANRVPRYVAHIVPLLFLMEVLPLAFVDFEYTRGIVNRVLMVTGVLLGLFVIKSVLASARDYLKTLPHLRDKPLDSYIQVVMIFSWIGGILTILAILTNTEIWKFFTALGAASAIILLIFKDSILGLVASIQVSINDMVRIGDWITFEKYGADGDVIEINLATVKVQNFDKTITTIPTYALISDSFKNWRGMQASGGRRIKRALHISQRSIRFLSPEDVESLKKIQLIALYLADRSEKIDAHNTQNNIDKSLPINGRNLTNIGVFRKYIHEYLENNPAIHKKMTLMVRQLPPSAQGVPLEIYAFSRDKKWENYEYIMADIFDHLLVALPYFGLELFEFPVYFPGENQEA